MFDKKKTSLPPTYKNSDGITRLIKKNCPYESEINFLP